MSSSNNANAMGATQPLILIFKRENYEFWFIRLKTLLKYQNVLDYAEHGYSEPNAEKVLTAEKQTRLKETWKKDAKSLAIIQQTVYDNVFSRITTAIMSKEV